MRFAPLLAILAVLLTAVPTAMAPVASYAQASAEIPPLPRPRPDRDAQPEEMSPEQERAAVEAQAAIEAAADIPQPVTLSARIIDGGTPITEGLIWRVFEGNPDESGEMALVAKAETANARIELRPGEYMLHVAYGRAQYSESITILPGGMQKDVILNVGGLRLHSAVTGDIPISPQLLTFEIYTTGDGANRALIADGIRANEIVTLNAGTYQIVSHFGTINAEVRADLRVEPGQMTDATLYHHASEVGFKLVSETGGEAIADVEWTVKDATGATLFTDRGAFPSTVLAEGDYSVLAKLGDRVFNRDFQIIPGNSNEIEVLTSI